MSRATNNVAARARHNKVLKTPGLPLRQEPLYKTAKEAVERSMSTPSAPQAEEASLPFAVDHANQRRGAVARLSVQHAHARAEGVADRDRSQGARRAGSQRAEGFARLAATAKQAVAGSVR